MWKIIGLILQTVGTLSKEKYTDALQMNHFMRKTQLINLLEQITSADEAITQISQLLNKIHHSNLWEN